jgi:ATP-dependent protease ClpP protease subunit
MARFVFALLSALPFFTLPFVTVRAARALEMTDRQVRLERELTIGSASKAAEELFKLDAAGNEPILLIIGTRSGYLPAAMVVVDAIGALHSKVHAVIQPEAFGPGAIIAAFCDKRFAFANASVLFNKFEYESEKVMKDSPPLPAAAAQIYVDRTYALVAKRLGLATDDFKKKAEAGWFLSAQEAKQAAVVTDIVDHVSWVELVVETIEVKKTATIKEKRPAAGVRDESEPEKAR